MALACSSLILYLPLSTMLIYYGWTHYRIRSTGAKQEYRKFDADTNTAIHKKSSEPWNGTAKPLKGNGNGS
jgi:hypothetical protein